MEEICHSAVLPKGEGAHPPGGNFLFVQKVTKNTFRGYAPKDPIYGNGVMESTLLPLPLGAGTPTKSQHFPLRLPACETDTRQTYCSCVYRTLQSMVRWRAVTPPGQRAAERAAR